MFRDQEDIKAEMRRRGLNCEALARAHGCPPSALRMAFLGPSKKGELIIAKALSMKPHEVWPDRWAKDGERLCKAGRKSSVLSKMSKAAA